MYVFVVHVYALCMYLVWTCTEGIRLSVLVLAAKKNWRGNKRSAQVSINRHGLLLISIPPPIIQSASKDIPEWMKYSTVHPSGDPALDTASTTPQPMEEATAEASALPGR